MSLEKSLLSNTIETETAKELGRQYDLDLRQRQAGGGGRHQLPETKKWDPLRDDIQMRARERKAQQLAAIDETYAQQHRRQRNLAVTLSPDLAERAPSAGWSRTSAGRGTWPGPSTSRPSGPTRRPSITQLFGKVQTEPLMTHGGGADDDGRSEPTPWTPEPAQVHSQPASPGRSFSQARLRPAGALFWLIACLSASAYMRFLKYDVR